MEEFDEQPSMDGRRWLSATFMYAPAIATLIVLALASVFVPQPRLALIIPVALFSGVFGAGPGENLSEAIVRAVIAAIPVAIMGHHDGFTGWLSQLLFAFLVGFAAGGLAFGSYRALTGQ